MSSNSLITLKSRNVDCYSLEKLHELFLSGNLTPTVYVKRELERANELAILHNAVVKIYSRNKILKQAAESTRRYKLRKPLGPFDGILFSIKNTTSSKVKHEKINKGSTVIHLDPDNEFMAIPDESVKEVEMLLAGGAIIFCMTTVPEMCWTGATATYYYGITRNPHNPLHTCGGSSGGAAVLAYLCIGIIHLGSDGLGSIRVPAACCGVVGPKYSYALGQSGVNNDPKGKFPFLSHAGPLCKHVSDVIIFTRELIKFTNVSTHLDLSDRFIKNEQKLKGLKIAVSKTLNNNVDYVEPIVWQNIVKMARICTSLGAQVTFVEPNLPTGNDSYIQCTTLLWYLIVKDYGDYANKFLSQNSDLKEAKVVDPGLLECIKRSNELKNIEKLKLQIQKIRQRTKQIMSDFHKQYDILITPTLPILPPLATSYLEQGWMYNRNNGKRQFIFDCNHNVLAFTCLFNFTHQPAISINAGFAPNRFGDIPIGCQIVGGINRDDLVLKVAYWLEKSLKTTNSKL